MARIASYQKDNSLHEKDKLFGSSYVSTNNGTDQFTTGNFTLEDLAGFFGNYITFDNTNYNLATITQTLETHTSDIAANASYGQNLGASFGVVDDQGNLTSLSEAFANNLLSVATSEDYATATQLNTLSARVTTNEADVLANATNITTVTASANTNASNITTNTGSISTNTTNIASNASDISTLQNDITTANTNISQNSTNITTLDSSVSTINTTITGQQGSISNNTTNITANASDISTLQNTLTTSNGNISQLQTDLTSLTSTVNTNTTDITTAEGNITTNTTNITTNASDISTLSNNLTTTNANVAQNASDVTSLTTTVTSNTNAISSNDADIVTANTNITTNANAISTLQNDLNTAEADIIQNATNHTSLTSTVNTNTSSINTNAGNITTANTNISTNASAISTLQNELNTAEADILQNASDVTSLTSTVNSNTSSIGTNSTNISNNASSISTLTNNLSTANTNISQNSSNITTLTTNVNTNTSDIGTNTTNISTNASNITTLTNDLNTAEADILSNSSDITSLTTTVNGNTGDISTNASSISTLNAGLVTANGNISANASDITTVTATANTNTGNISTNASNISTINTTVNGHTTSIQTNATSINGIEGRYGVTIDNNGALTGFQLLSGASSSSFIINANDFKIYTGGGNLTPFSVSGSTVLIDGQLNVSGTATIQGSSNTGDFIAAQFINSGSSGLSSIKVRNNAGYYGLYRLNTTVSNNIGYYGVDIVIGPASGGGEHKLANFFNGGMSLGGGSSDKLIFNDNYAANTSSTGAGAVYVAGSTDGQNTQAMFITVPSNQSTSTPALNIETNSSNSIFKVFRNSHVETGTITTSGQIRGASLTSDAGITASGAITTNSTVKGTQFIDHDNATYYLDPASTSNLNAATFVGTISGQNQYLAQDLALGFTSGNIGGKLDIVRSSAGIGIKNNYGSSVSSSTIGLLQYTSAAATSSGYHLVFQAAPPSGTDQNMLLCDLDGGLRNRYNEYGQYSDENIKENIVAATDKLEEVKQLQVKNFNLIGDDFKQIGLIAQDVEQIFPSLVKNTTTPDGTEVKSLKYSVLVPILIKAIQELEARVAQLETP